MQHAYWIRVLPLCPPLILITSLKRTSPMTGGKECLPSRSCRRCRLDPWVGEILWRRKWQPTPVFLPGKSQGQRSLEGYSPWGHKEWTRLKLLSTPEHACTSLKTLSPSTVTWGIRVSAYTFGGTQTFSPSHLVVPETDQQLASTRALTSSDRK